MKKIIVPVLMLIMQLSACSAPGDIEIHNAWARPTALGENAAVYLAIHNHTDADDELTGASSNVADALELHESRPENDVMEMTMLASIPIAADQEIIFLPGELHIMLVHIKQELAPGEHIGVILHFKDHEDIVVNVHIENTMPDEDHGH